MIEIETLACGRATPMAGQGTLAISQGEATWALRIPDDEPVFAGHYPNNPIFPGVYTLDLMCQCVEHWALAKGERLTLAVVRSIRYTRAIGPGDNVRIEIRIEDPVSEQEVAVRAVAWRGDDKAVSARLLMRHVR
ncbi:MAG: hypothetical protein DI568_15010 [Sphingomonas sp.]|jgi:3-hydroxyacyl-[acyl-carrier-protein] dehydratase|nr:MAG: hypothetical protein DI568_15010 [Sphingomonas sp.]